MCWYCYWGWSKPVADIYRRYVERAGEGAMHFGPAHIVWEDENFERAAVQWCLDHFDEHCDHRYAPEQWQAVRDSLTALLALPDDVRDPEPQAYKDSETAVPQDYPPSIDMAQR